MIVVGSWWAPAAVPSAAADTGATIEGAITLAGGGSPCGLEIRLYDTTTATPIRAAFFQSVDGVGDGYRFASLPPGSYRVRFGPEMAPICGGPAAISWNSGVLVPADAPVLAVADGDVIRSDQQVRRAGRIGGAVTYHDGSPLLGATTVRAYSRTGDFATKVRTDPKGTYLFPSLPAGTYDVRWGDGIFVSPVWYGDAADRASSTPVVVTEGATTTADAAFPAT